MRATIQSDNGQVVGVLEAEPRQFRTGSKGYFGTGKVTIDGRKYQAQLQMVEVHSKDNGSKAKKAETRA